MRILYRTALLSILCSFAHSNDDQQAINYIQQQLNASQEQSELWQWGWSSFFITTLSAQVIGSQMIEDEDIRYRMRVGSITNSAGLVAILVNPMKTHRYAEELSKLEGNNSDQLADKRVSAEYYLAAAARREREEQSWVNHLLAGMVNSLASLTIAYDGKQPSDAWMAFAVGTAVSELKIYTAPQAMIKAEQDYNNGNYYLKAAKRPQPHWNIAAMGPHISIDWRF
jgi:hypothetical protein